MITFQRLAVFTLTLLPALYAQSLYDQNLAAEALPSATTILTGRQYGTDVRPPFADNPVRADFQVSEDGLVTAQSSSIGGAGLDGLARALRLAPKRSLR